MKMHTVRRSLVALITLAALPGALPTTTPLAHAQAAGDAGKAKALLDEARESYELGDFATALTLYKRSDTTAHSFAAALGAARCHVRLGQLLEGYEAYDRLAQEAASKKPPASPADLVVSAQKERKDLDGRVPKVVFVLKGAVDGAVTLDGAPVAADALKQPRPVNPGKHVVEVAESKNAKALRLTVEAAEGKSVEAVLAPEAKPTAPPPPPDRDGDGISDGQDACPAVAGVASKDPKQNGCPPPADRDGDGVVDGEDACPFKAGVRSAVPEKNGCPAEAPAVAPAPAPAPAPRAEPRPDAAPPAKRSTLSTMASVSFVVGGFSLLTGAATGGYTVIQNETFKSKCPNGLCPASQKDAVSTYNTLRTVSTATLIGGGVFLFAGSIMSVLAPKPGTDSASGSRSLDILVGATSAELRGRF